MARFTQAGGSGSGEPGPQGPQGLQGIQGEPGAQGPAGDPFGIYYLGDYVPTNGYVTDIAVVRGSDGQLYLAKASGQLGDPINYQSNGQWEVWIPKGTDGANGSDGAAGADGEDALWNFLGEWENGIDYAAGSVVEYQGSSYYHPTGQFSSYSPPGYGWLLVASKGDQGETGLQGEQGEPGAQGDIGPAGSDAPTDRIYSGNYQAIIDVSGTTTFDGNIVPSAASYSLGTEALPWKDIYVSAGSIKIADNDMVTDAVSIKNTDGYLVLSRGGLKVTDNTDEFEVFQLNPDGTLVLKSNVVEGTSGAALEIIGSLNGTSIDPSNTGVLLHLTGLRNSPSRIYNDSYGTGVYSAYIGRHARGTSEDPEGLIAGDIISRIGGNSFLSSGVFAPISNVRMDFVVRENQTDTARGNEIQFWTTADGSIAPTRSFTLENTGLTFPDNTKQTTAAVSQIQSDWTQTNNTSLDYIKNKPTLPDLSGYGVPTAYSPVWSGTGLTYTGTPATGSYMKMGKMVTFRIKIQCATVSNFGSGQYSLTLPFAPASDYIFRDGGIHHVSGTAHYQMSGDAESGTTQLTLWYTASQGQDQAMNHNSPHALQTADYFYISGTYESV